MVTIRKTKKVRRLVNPTRPKKSSAPKRKATARRQASKPKPRRKATAKAKRNPAPVVVTAGYLNPQGATMSRRRKKTTRRPVSRVRRRRNPSRITTRATSTLKTGAYALGGLVLTRQIPQALLGSRNSGVVGYAANVATAIAASVLVAKVGGKAAGQAVGIGGGLYVVERILNEQFTPLGRALSLSGVGDAHASGGLGAIQRAYFPWPVVTDKTGAPVIPREIIDAAKAEIPAAAAPQPTSMGRFAGRF